MKLTSQILAGFVGSVLAPNFDGTTSTPEFHHEMWDLCCSDHKYVAMAAPRGHAKSTAITISYGLATLLFRQRKFMVLVSDTEAQSSGFLMAFKQALQGNEDLITLFDLKKNDKGEVEFIRDTNTDIIVQFNDGYMFRVVAKGSEQKLRGLLWDNIRPDIILCDDMENDELVMNKERREKMQRWFYSALLPCMSNKGIIRVVGTILHMDSLLENMMPKLSDHFTVVEELKEHSTRKIGLWVSVKYRAHNDNFTRLLWPSNKDINHFKELYENHRRQGTLDIYSQEYLNRPMDDSMAFFKKKDLLAVSKDEVDCPLKYYISVDLAISEKERADYSVFLVAGVDENRRIHVVDIIRERMDGREIVDTLLQLGRVYNPEVVGIESMQVSKAIGPFLREEMIRKNVILSILELKHGGKDKIARARSIQARTRAKGVKFKKESDWYPLFEEECLTFPRGKHDDQVDAFAYLGMMLDNITEAPTREEIEDERYNDELDGSGLNGAGRNSVTGY
jgi:predicted phage terminase large subunit-like protein